MPIHSPRRTLRRTLVLAAAAGTLAATIATAGAGAAPRVAHPHGACTASATVCAMNVLAPAGGTRGVYLRQVGGPVLASANATFAFEPASSIKPLIALYVLNDMKKGFTTLSTTLPAISTAGGPDDCPPSTISGTDTKATALQQMLQVSDNNRTRELMQWFGVANLNAFAASLGLTHTHFQTSTSPPGFNVIGCNSYVGPGLPPYLDGNTISLTDMAKLWTDIAAQPAPYANAFFQLGAGREMLNSQGYDFTGVWPAIKTTAAQVKPSSMTAGQLASFLDHAFVSVKGGSYDWYVCTSGSSCMRAWVAWGFYLQLPSCVGATMRHTAYVGGDFIHGSTTAYASTPPAFNLITPALTTMLTKTLKGALASWHACVPKTAPKLHLTGVSQVVSHTPDLVELAAVTDTDVNDVAADMQATVNWGDGSAISDATLVPVAGKGHFQVAGWHDYALQKKYTITVTVRSEATGKTVAVKSTLTVT
jgi:hypothetical protein